MTEELVKRINELAKKAKTEGLTDAEIEERDKLRKEYIRLYRKSLTDILDNTVIQYPDGTRKPLKKSGSNHLS